MASAAEASPARWREGWRQHWFGSLLGQLRLVTFLSILVGFSTASLFTLLMHQQGMGRLHRDEEILAAGRLRVALERVALEPSPRHEHQLQQELDRSSSAEHLFWVRRSDGSLLVPTTDVRIDPRSLAMEVIRHVGAPSQPLSLAVLLVGADQQRVTVTDGRSFVSHAHPVETDGSELWVADDITGNVTVMRHLLLGLLLVWTLCLLLTLVAVTLLTQRLLQPLRDLSRMAEGVTSESLSSSHLKLDHAPMELQELALSYNNLLDRLAVAWTQQRQFVGLVSHELRNPLMIIGGYLRRLQRRGQNLEPEQMRALATTEAETHRITRMLNDLLDLSRSESGQLQMLLTPVAVDEVLTTASDLARSQLSRPLILNLPEEASEGPIKAVAETDRLQQVLLNLIENADKYSLPGRPITLELAREAEGLCISVCDQGIGIAPEDVPKVFDRFHRGRNAMEHERGSGLGLSVVKLLVEAMGGSIDLDSELGVGSRFHIHLPAAQ